VITLVKPQLVNREPFSSTIKNGLLGRLRDLSDETRIPISKLLDEALEDLLIKYSGGSSNKRNKNIQKNPPSKK
jgi:hypothetical protein